MKQDDLLEKIANWFDEHKLGKDKVHLIIQMEGEFSKTKFKSGMDIEVILD